MRAPLLLACAGVLVGCGAEEGFLVVTVDARPAVHDAASLRVTLANGGTMRTDELGLAGASFPVTFSISAPGRTGELNVTVDALDAADLLVGRGAVSTTVEATDTSVMLDSVDFVVNTDFAGEQYPSPYFDTHGAQAAATADGRWTVAYRDGCAAPCNMFARQFDPSGRPQSTQIAAGTNGFALSTLLTTSLSAPSVAAAGSTTLAAWNYRDTGGSGNAGIACRSIDSQGGAITPDEVDVSQDLGTDLVQVAALPNNNFAVTWIALDPVVIRGAVLRPDCTALAAPVTISTSVGATRPSVAANGTSLLYAWQTNGAVYVRLASATNALQGATDTQFLPATASEVVEYVRVAPLGAGFAVLVRWAQLASEDGPGRIDLYRTNAMGAVLGPPVPVTTRAGSDFASAQKFGVATSGDGVLFVTWHACDANGDGQGCGVFGRAFRADGTAIGPELSVPTTTVGDQTGPSVAALPAGFAVTWRDDSMQAPDVSGSSVRARIIYPEMTGATTQ